MTLAMKAFAATAALVLALPLAAQAGSTDTPRFDARQARQEQRLVRRLISRGFSLRAAREAVRDREPESPDT